MNAREKYEGIDGLKAYAILGIALIKPLQSCHRSFADIRLCVKEQEGTMRL